MNISGTTERTTLQGIESKTTNTDFPSVQTMDYSPRKLDFQHSRGFDKFVRENQLKADVTGIYNISKDENGNPQVSLDGAKAMYGEDAVKNTADISGGKNIQASNEDEGGLEKLKNKIDKQDNNAKDDGKPKRIGTMGMLEKICRREGPNGTCNHNDDTPGAYTERPIYG